MDNQEINPWSIFAPEMIEKEASIIRDSLKFVQYTSADAAMNIIQNEEVWLRNTQCMNDYMELEHGFDCLSNTFRSNEVGVPFRNLLNSLYDGISEQLVKWIDSWLPAFRRSSYIACVSEHPKDENEYGRLSMWRAYGGNNSVALILNPEPLRAPTDAFNAYSYPVHYLDEKGFREQFKSLTKRIEENREYLLSIGRDTFWRYLAETFKNYLFCIKHPGFIEEREWRVVYNPEYNSSEHIESEIVSLNGVPQEVMKIKLQNIPEKNFTGATIPEFIEKIIIGPSDNASILVKTFIKLLKDAGCEDAESRVVYSGIPLRR